MLSKVLKSLFCNLNNTETILFFSFPKGEIGDPGPPGIMGEKGRKGDKGAKGEAPPGPKGRKGKKVKAINSFNWQIYSQKKVVKEVIA